jgi:alpha-tubulin suppressor-like RCC1 family protein
VWVAAWLVGLASGAANAGASARGALGVKIVGLPAGSAGLVKVSGPGRVVRVLRRSLVLDGLMGGVYRVRVLSVRLSRGFPGIPAGSEAFPSRGVVTVRVRRGRRSVVTASYGTILSSLTKALHAGVLSVRGSPSAPSAIVLARSQSGVVAPGVILAQAPSAILPGGLFDQVSAVQRGGGGLVVSLRPASLWDAFPSLDLHVTVPLTLAASAQAGSVFAHSADGLGSAVDLGAVGSLLKGRLEAGCGGPPAGWSFSPSGSVHPSLTADIQYTKSISVFGHQITIPKPPTGELSATVDANVGLDTTIPSGVHCDLTIPGPKFDAAILVGPIPVPVEGSLDFAISIATEGPVHVHDTASLDVTGGIDLHGTYATPIFKLSPHASGALTGAGRLSFGLPLQAGLGTTGLNAHVGLTPDIVRKFSSTICEIDLGGSANTGLSLGPFNPSLSTPEADITVYHCTPDNNANTTTGNNPGSSTTPTGGTPPGGGGPTGGATTTVEGHLAASSTHTCALLGGGGVDCWGQNTNGELGNGTMTSSSTPVSVSDIADATTIGSAAADQTCAVLSTGGVDCWGDNFFGQLGDGTTTDSSTPVPVAGISIATAVAGGGGGGHTCALLATDSIDCWGHNASGQLGDATTDDSTTPVAVNGINTATAISAGGYNDTCALLSGGSVRCWGDNGRGELGDGTTTNRDLPVTVSGLTNATAISAGFQHTCALLATGAVECWGSNSSGQLGDGTTTDSATPVAIQGVTTAIAVSAGGAYTCALLAGGSSECWGSNSSGQLGDGTTTDSATPVATGVSDATEISAGYDHTCALLADNSIQCWGDNGTGDLGDGTTTNSDVPVAVSGLP